MSGLNYKSVDDTSVNNDGSDGFDGSDCEIQPESIIPSITLRHPTLHNNSGVQRSSTENSLQDSLNLYTPPESQSTNPKRYRDIIRRSSVIMAQSGKKVHRTVSLSSDIFNTSYSDNHNGTENEPLLGDENSGDGRYFNDTRRYLRRKVLEPAKEVYYNDVYRNVLKCSIAYLIASLGVYWTPFDVLLGNTDSKHVVATVATYFHPARSKGSMTQTLIYVVVSLLFTFVVSFGCRLISTVFFKQGADEVSHAIDLVVSSIALGIIAFMKQKVNKQTFNTACSLASISIVSCIVKEGSLNSADIPIERLQSTFQVVVVGCIIAVGICYLLWPVSSVRHLRKSLNDSYDIMSSCLSVVAKRFLTGEKLTPRDNEIFNALKSNLTELLTNLEEAKFELRCYGREQEWQLFNRLVETTISLARHLQALRSSTEMQWNLLHSHSSNSEMESEINSLRSLDSYTSDILRLSQSVENMTTLNSEPNIDHHADNSAQLFDLFVSYLSPSIRSFIFTLKGVMSEVPFEKFSEEFPHKFAKTTNLQISLKTSIQLYEQKQAESFSKLYDQEIFKKPADFLFKADQEEVTACCGNFSSLLGLYGNELMEFIKLSEKYEAARESPLSWPWLSFHYKRENRAPSEEEIRKQSISLNAALLDLQSQLETSDASAKKKRKGMEKWTYRLWKSLKVFRRTDVQFGIRVGLGAFCLAVFAFLPQTKVTFNNWRLEWSLAIYCIMMNKSLGGTTMTVKWRILGTFMGAFSAYVVWMVTDGNVYALCFTGFLISLPSFYIIIYWSKNNAFGRFILLTYNLTALYSYSMRSQQDSEDGGEGGDNPFVEEIAFHRFVAVSIGIIWALVMASCFLPNSARSRLKSGLTVLWLRLGLIWYSDPLEYDPISLRLIGLKDKPGVNRLLSECETLLKQAPIEFRLKGSFPTEAYSSLLKYTSSIIDNFENISLMIKVDPVLSVNEEFVLKYIEAERNEVEHRIFLIFYMIASSMKLGFPIPSKPASIEHAKDRMLFKLSEVRDSVVQKPELSLTNNDFILLYSYILVASSITEQLDNIMELLRELLGDVSEEIFQLV
ncbi:Fusaric acid resistance protein-like-domain-containing protein [Scheffersomyces xylosifermentans]|uniref:Fusaric acid resistance protein-like-domain-containing protein n=1 Tax=Scheffersomyces xylosifermentans TaxID=1304137 RepID=UPI00315DE48B